MDFMKHWPKIPLLNSKVKSMTVGSSGDLSGVAALVPQLCKFTKKKKKSHGLEHLTEPHFMVGQLHTHQAVLKTWKSP